MNTQEKSPAAGHRWAAEESGADNAHYHAYYTPRPFFVNFIGELNALAQAARAAGNYADFWDYRRRYLLAQAAAYAKGVRL